jgi:hypothetical protein
MIVAVTALVVALGRSSYAAVKLPNNSVSTAQLRNNSVTSAKVKDRSLKAADFGPGQLPSGAKGDTGARGPQGPQGAQGPQGDRGPTGTVDTSDFYDKTTSDGRFLGIGAQAADADKLDGLSSGSFIQGNGSRSLTGTFAAAGGSAAIPFDGIGSVRLSCSDPASATVRIALQPGRAASVYTDNGSGTTTFETLSAGGQSTSVSAPTARHVEWRIASGIQSSEVSAWIVSGPGGANSCLIDTAIDVTP